MPAKFACEVHLVQVCVMSEEADEEIMDCGGVEVLVELIRPKGNAEAAQISQTQTTREAAAAILKNLCTGLSLYNDFRRYVHGNSPPTHKEGNHVDDMTSHALISTASQAYRNNS